MKIRKEDLLKTYSGLSDIELHKIAHNLKSYTLEAREAAKELLNGRDPYAEKAKRGPRPRPPKKKSDNSYIRKQDGHEPRTVRSSSGPFSVLLNIVAFFLEDLFPSFNQIAFFALWALLCYLTYLFVNYFIFS